LRHISFADTGQAPNFNVDEIKEELSLLENAPIGIYFDKPVALYNAVALLQNGCIRGWQLYQERGRITARVNNPDRTPWGKIAYTDIINIKSLRACSKSFKKQIIISEGGGECTTIRAI
jgi:hypothetical protein